MSLSKLHNQNRLVFDFYAKFKYDTQAAAVVEYARSDMITQIEHTAVGTWAIYFDRDLRKYPTPYTAGEDILKTPLVFSSYEYSIGFITAYPSLNILALVSYFASLNGTVLESVAPADDQIINLAGGWALDSDAKYIESI